MMSEAMVMCASSPDNVEILDPPESCVPGDRVTFTGYTGECERVEPLTNTMATPLVCIRIRDLGSGIIIQWNSRKTSETRTQLSK